MPLQATSGAASYDAFGGGVAVVPTYIEDVFSTYLRTSNGTTATVVNNLDLSGKGGLVWTKNRGSAQWHVLYDTVRGGAYSLTSNNTGVSRTNVAGAVTFNADGYSIVAGFAENNASGNTYVDWVLRKQPKFFDVVTYSGNGLPSNIISHNLGSVPGFIICKRTDSTSGWALWHRGNGTTSYGLFALNSTAAAVANVFAAPTSTTFDAYNIWDTGNPANAGGATYIAYLFAHNAGGFGLTGTDNVISCGSYTGNGSATGPVVNLGYEPQFIILKAADGGTSGSQDWNMIDNMRGWTTSSNQQLNPNLSAAETSQNNIALNATGFQPITAAADFNGNGNTYIYVAIRRGPMKVPTTGTSVFTPVARTGTRAAGSVTGIGFPPDNLITLNRTPGGYNPEWNNKLVGPTKYLRTSTVGTEITSTDLASYDQNGVSFNATDFNSIVNLNSPLIQYFLQRAPGFMDVVITPSTYTTGIVNHNLTVIPELMIEKTRTTSSTNWRFYHKDIASAGALNLTDAFDKSLYPRNPTSTTFEYGNNNAAVYLFATCPGVSKVGSYTGTGTTLQIDCGFTAGARFVLIKRTDSTGDWYVWDTARGIVSGNDPYLLINSTAVEVTSTDYIDTYSAGFEISSTAPAAINSSASGATYIFLAIA